MPPVTTRSRRTPTPGASGSDAESATSSKSKPATKQPKVSSGKPLGHKPAPTRPKRALSPSPRAVNTAQNSDQEADDDPPPRRLNFAATTTRTTRRPTSEIPSFIAFSPLRATSPPRPPPRVLVTPPTPSHCLGDDDNTYDPCLPSRGFTPIEVDANTPASVFDSALESPRTSATLTLTPSALAAERRAHRAELHSAHTQLEEQDAELARVHVEYGRMMVELADSRAREAALEAQRAAMEARALDEEARKRRAGDDEHAVRAERESLYAAFNDLREAVDDEPFEPSQSCVVQ